MPISNSVVKSAVLAAMPTKSVLQAAIWAQLQTIGFKQHNISTINPETGNPYPDTKDFADVIADYHWEHIKTVSDIVVDEILNHLVAFADATVTVPVHAPGGSTIAIGLGVGGQGIT